jgi:hypothetical protein
MLWRFRLAQHAARHPNRVDVHDGLVETKAEATDCGRGVVADVRQRTQSADVSGYLAAVALHHRSRRFWERLAAAGKSQTGGEFSPARFAASECRRRRVFMVDVFKYAFDC